MVKLKVKAVIPANLITLGILICCCCTQKCSCSFEFKSSRRMPECGSLCKELSTNELSSSKKCNSYNSNSIQQGAHSKNSSISFLEVEEGTESENELGNSSNESSQSNEYDGDIEESPHQFYGAFIKNIPKFSNISKLFSENIQSSFSPININQEREARKGFEDSENESQGLSQGHGQDMEQKSRFHFESYYYDENQDEDDKYKSENKFTGTGTSKSSNGSSESFSFSEEEQEQPFEEEEEGEDRVLSSSYRSVSSSPFSRPSLFESTDNYEENENINFERKLSTSSSLYLDLFSKISAQQLKQIDLIDQLASEQAHQNQNCPNVGLRIFYLLLEQLNQSNYDIPVISEVQTTNITNIMDALNTLDPNASNRIHSSNLTIPNAASSFSLAFELLNQLVIVYSKVLESTSTNKRTKRNRKKNRNRSNQSNSSSNRNNNLDLIEIIEKCLKAIIDLFDIHDLKIVKNAFLLLILNNPEKFDENIKKIFIDSTTPYLPLSQINLTKATTEAETAKTGTGTGLVPITRKQNRKKKIIKKSENPQFSLSKYVMLYMKKMYQFSPSKYIRANWLVFVLAFFLAGITRFYFGGQVIEETIAQVLRSIHMNTTTLYNSEFDFRYCARTLGF